MVDLGTFEQVYLTNLKDILLGLDQDEDQSKEFFTVQFKEGYVITAVCAWRYLALT